MFTIEKASIAHLSDITAIYNEAVLHTTATFDVDEKSLTDRTHWFQNRSSRYGIYVVKHQTQIIGYGALNTWSDKAGYFPSAEISLYVKPDFQGKGIGTQLLKILLEHAHQHEFKNIIARITADNLPSIHLHQKAGFTILGIMQRCGYKFHKWHDVMLLQFVFA